VVQVTIDGLPTETLMQHKELVRPDGLGKFLDEGTVFTGAEYTYLTTFTAVGHATLFTGTQPFMHGIIGNEWLDEETGEQVYCVEDPTRQILDFPTKAHEGTSPRNLESSTIGDELVRASGGKSRVFSVSGKDRGAILPAGKKGKAFWYSKNAATFVTSDYYYTETPDWLSPWRKDTPVDAYIVKVWDLLRKPGDYLRYSQDDRASEKGLGPVFPHILGLTAPEKIADTLRWTPYLDELTLSLSLLLMEKEEVGKKGATDMVCISLSSMDFVSHQYGPDSLEAEDTLYRVDALIETLLAYLDSHIGLEHVLLVLSADHGFARSPEQIIEEGLPASRIVVPEMEKRLDEIRGELNRRYGLAPEAIRGYLSSCIYFDRQIIAKSGQDLEVIQQAVAELAAAWPETAWAASRKALMRESRTGSWFHDRAAVSLHSSRSGDVVVVLKPWVLPETPETAYPATHGSPYAYDTRVPILFLGNGIPAQQVQRVVSPLDIAATLAACLNITPPPACMGQPLAEIVQH
jgi:predicted AlkP superfamily pyrophosphatase or phosphodiesterase